MFGSASHQRVVFSESAKMYGKETIGRQTLSQSVELVWSKPIAAHDEKANRCDNAEKKRVRLRDHFERQIIETLWFRSGLEKRK